MYSALAGACYVVGGVVGILLNLCVAGLIANDKTMKNATYKFMTQLAFGEVESLLANMFLPGLIMLAGLEDPPDIVLRLITFCDEAGFRATNYWMILIALSRWLSFAKRHILPVLFSDSRHMLTCALIWFGAHMFHSPILYYRDSIVPGVLDYEYTNSTYSQLVNISDWFHDIGSGLLQILFQALTVAWILNTRHQILSPEMRVRNKREIRLFIQCSLDSVVYCSLIVVSNTNYVRQYRLYRETWVFYLVDCLLFFNHIDCAVFYFCFNRQLRTKLATVARRATLIQSGSSAIQRQANAALILHEYGYRPTRPS